MLNQIQDLLGVLEDKILQKPLSAFGGSTIGQHVRHIFDFYDCIIRGQQAGLIDYSDRNRNQHMEQFVDFASSGFDVIEHGLEALTSHEDIMVSTDFSPDVNVDRLAVKSSIGRELMFACDHAVHHLAMIKMGMRAHYPMIPIDEDLGLAPSTIKNEQGEHVSE